MFNFIHFFFVILLLICVFFVVTSSNPVESVLFLVLSFVNASIILILFKLEFFGILFLMIYVGAIAILFLFVVMMLNIKRGIAFFNNFNFKNILLMCCIILIFYIVIVEVKLFFLFSLPTTNLSLIEYELKEELYPFSSLNSMNIFGQGLYNGFAVTVILCGILLLISLIGAVVLTLNYNKKKIDAFTKNEASFRQLSRSDKFIKISKP